MTPDIRRDPLSGRLSVFAPGRSQRPGAQRPTLEQPAPDELETCPFCAGREDRTPPETLALGRESTNPDTPGWKVRVVPNLYPAFERQEVVVHSPQHVRSFADLPAQQISLVAQAWSERAEAAFGDGFRYVHAALNEGSEAGASRPHSHSQLVWLREAPPAVAEERQEHIAEVLESGALAVAGRDVERTGDVVAVVHPAGRAPYECLIAPREARANGLGDGAFLVAALELLAELIRRLQKAEGAVPWNAWLHEGEHWHLELLPRLTVLASVELGAGIYVNPLPPEHAAERLREVEL